MCADFKSASPPGRGARRLVLGQVCLRARARRGWDAGARCYGGSGAGPAQPSRARAPPQATNYEEGVASAADDDANDDDALMRFELHEMLVRMAFSKFIASREMSDASDAVDRLMADYVMPNLPAEALVDPNEFRFQRMYAQDVEEVLVANGALVDAVFKARRCLSCA